MDFQSIETTDIINFKREIIANRSGLAFFEAKKGSGKELENFIKINRTNEKRTWKYFISFID